ncbi:hypothetical protein [Thermoplasma volcanium GSS1]|uniref:GP-PDE domain-containing protein n=1 Tax=Thermoplasma volcanium (strain ATCC 51530 / DSM 4299 / JCM 9571 / NBRC 15438 / GSS1) TaxID=273116 RepID=Q97AF5_THEVO|nr:glycerophosphodiester phosphodiesterase [Thermoplasma volcanium]BAB59997.1 hypothetical protein [Thermoplasma volcanium GSS1]
MKYSDISEVKLISGGPIPSLSEVLERYSSMNYFIEIKVEHFDNKAARLVDLVANNIYASRLIDRSIVISFSGEAIDYLTEHYPDIRSGLDFDDPGLLEDAQSKYGVLLPHYFLISQDFCRNLRKPVIPWTVDDVELANKLKKLGCKGIITNVGDRMLSAIK